MNSYFQCLYCKANASSKSVKCRVCGRWGGVQNLRDEGDRYNGPVPLNDVDEEEAARMPTGLPELDAFLGGGFVLGCTYLLSGDPGAGKSTLTLTLADCHESLIVTGEETQAAVRIRQKRLDLECPDTLIWETEDLTECLERDRPEVLHIFDSIHRFRAKGCDGSLGSVQMLQHVTHEIAQFVQHHGIVGILICHVNKDNEASGPKTVEHLVDATLHLKITPLQGIRVLTVNKNRHGPAPAKLDFVMTDRGIFPGSDRELHAVGEDA